MLILADLSPCFVWWTQSFHSHRCTCVNFQNHKRRYFRGGRDVLKKFVFGPSLFSLRQRLPATLSSSFGCYLYSDNLVLWFFSSTNLLLKRLFKKPWFDLYASVIIGFFLLIRVILGFLIFGEFLPDYSSTSPLLFHLFSSPQSYRQLFLGHL